MSAVEDLDSSDFDSVIREDPARKFARDFYASRKIFASPRTSPDSSPNQTLQTQRNSSNKPTIVTSSNRGVSASLRLAALDPPNKDKNSKTNPNGTKLVEISNKPQIEENNFFNAYSKSHVKSKSKASTSSTRDDVADISHENHESLEKNIQKKIIQNKTLVISNQQDSPHSSPSPSSKKLSPMLLNNPINKPVSKQIDDDTSSISSSTHKTTPCNPISRQISITSENLGRRSRNMSFSNPLTNDPENTELPITSSHLTDPSVCFTPVRRNSLKTRENISNNNGSQSSSLSVTITSNIFNTNMNSVDDYDFETEAPKIVAPNTSNISTNPSSPTAFIKRKPHRNSRVRHFNHRLQSVESGEFPEFGSANNSSNIPHGMLRKQRSSVSLIDFGISHQSLSNRNIDTSSDYFNNIISNTTKSDVTTGETSKKRSSKTLTKTFSNKSLFFRTKKTLQESSSRWLRGTDIASLINSKQYFLRIPKQTGYSKISTVVAQEGDHSSNSNSNLNTNNITYLDNISEVGPTDPKRQSILLLSNIPPLPLALLFLTDLFFPREIPTLHDPNLLELIHSLQMKQSQILKLYRIFQSLDKDQSSQIPISSFLQFLQEDRSIFMDKLLLTVQMHELEYVTFECFLRFFVVFCSYSKEDLMSFCSSMIGEDCKGVLFEELSRCLMKYGYIFISDYEKKLGEINALQDQGLSLKEFKKLITEYSLVLHPVIRIQEKFQSLTLGTRAWSVIAQRQYAKNHESPETKGDISPSFLLAAYDNIVGYLSFTK